MPPRRKASTAAAAEEGTSPLQQIQPTTRASRPSRSTAKQSLSTPPPDDDDQEEEPAAKPVAKTRPTRTSRSSAASQQPTTASTSTRSTRTSQRDSLASTASTTASSSARAKTTTRTRASATAPSASAARASRRTRASEASLAESVEPEASDAEDEREDQQAEDQEEEEDIKPKTTRRGGKKTLPPPSPASTVEIEQEESDAPSEQDEDEEEVEQDEVEEEVEDEEEEDVKPVVRKRGKKASMATPPAEQDVEEEQSEDDEEATPVKKTHAKSKSRAKRVVEDSPSSSTGDAEPAAEEDDPSSGQQLATPAPSQGGDDSDGDVAADLLPPSTPRAQVAEPEDGLKVPPAPIPAPTPAPINVAPTAYDLAAAARMAALNHAAMEKEREKEREGKPRLVIHQLVLEDFKSYRGRGIIGPFHKSFSSIVGPNGSGKSNTIDALLFVFGYRATKMRQGKLSELIHNSGAVVDADENAAPQDVEGAEFEDDDSFDEEEEWDTGKKKKGGKKGKGKKSAPAASEKGLIGQCTVEVWFREIIDLPGGRDEFEVVPNSQLVVARTAYRNNSSRYTINGKTSTFTEVTTLLKGRGIDLDHKRFLILQGEVESIAQMKPKGATEHDEGLLEYLEDIIGTSKYKSEIETAIVEVDRLNDARGVQMNRVKLVEREKSALEGRKKEADGYLRDQNELAHNQSALFQVHMHQANQNSLQFQEDVAAATTELETEIAAQAGTRKEVEDLQTEYNTLVKDTKEIEKAANEVSKHLAVLDRADVQLQEKKKSALAKVKKLKKSLQDDTHARSEAETWIRNHGETIERVGADVEKMEGTLEKEEAELERITDGLKGKTETFTAKIDALQKDLQPWAEQIADKQAAIDLVANERDLLTEKSESIKVAIEEAQATLSKLASDDEAKNERLESLLAEKQEVEDELATLQAQLDGMQAEDTKLRSKATAARQKADEAKASQSASRSQGNVLSSLTKLKDQGRLPGFHGRLGNLGRIDDKYDVAISTAAPGLDNLVTDTIKVGQACIEHLRKNDLGRANVMCLDRITPRDMSPIQTPENAPRLFDLVTPKDPKLAPAFYQILTNTLVANDLDQGKRLAFGSGNKRWRVVTLDGQVIDVSGTMSGGGGRPAKGRMSSKIAADEVSPEQVARCEQEQQVAVEALRVFSEDRVKVEKSLQALRKRVPDIDMSISKIEMDLKTSDKRVDEANKRLEELKTQSRPEAGDVKKIAQFEKDIASLTKDLGRLQKEASAIDDEIKLNQEEILKVGGVKLRGQQTKVQDLKAQIDLGTDRLTKAEVGKAKSEKDVKKLAKSIEASTAAVEATEAELHELQEQIETGANDSDAVRQTVEQVQDTLADKREELATMKESLDEKVDIMTQFRKREAELTRERDAAQKLLDEALKAIDHWSERLGELQLNDLDDDDDEEEGEKAAAATEKDHDAEPSEEKVKAPKLDSELRPLSDEEVAGLDVKVLKAKISVLEERIANTNLDLSVLKEYARREKEFMQRAADLEAVTKERDTAKQLADDLRNQRLKEFMEGFGIISMKLKEMYQMITLGGNAELELVDSLDPFSEGIIFSVMPPKKSWKNISNLSGGEKTLSSLALVFALHVFKPTPLYFMDEIDAALDFRNVSIVANYIKDRTKNAQFIIISLRNNMFELSSRLIGIYKVQNQTRSVAIDNRDLSQMAVTAAA